MSDVLVVPNSIPGRPDAPPAAFVCSRSDDGPDAAWIHLRGELDLATAPDLELRLREARAEAAMVVLDLRDLEFMDSCGVRTILDASIRARQVGRRLVVLRGCAQVDRMFVLTGRTGDLELTDNVPVKPFLKGRDGLVEERRAL
jgi:anti-anti-sigma factor